MKKNETIAKIITRFTDITNSLVALSKTYTQVKIVRKVLQAVTLEWEKKNTVIEEANDHSTLTLENLIENLVASKYKCKKKKKDEQSQPKKNVFAFKTSSDSKDLDDEEEEDIAMITRKFRIFLRKSKFNKTKDTKEALLCFKCNKSGHMKKDM